MTALVLLFIAMIPIDCKIFFKLQIFLKQALRFLLHVACKKTENKSKDEKTLLYCCSTLCTPIPVQNTPSTFVAIVFEDSV